MGGGGGGGHAFRIPTTSVCRWQVQRQYTVVRLPVSKFFKIITWKERKVHLLSKNLHQSVPHAHNETCLACKQTEKWIEIKFEVDTKFKMDAIAHFAGWRHKSRDSNPCYWNTWRYLLFCCYYLHGRRVSSICQITERLLFFRISTEPPKAFVGPSQYFGHIHHWSHR